MERTAAAHGAAILIGGDLNEQEPGPSWRYLAGRLTDCRPAAPRGKELTFPARRPRERIDAAALVPVVYWFRYRIAAPAAPFGTRSTAIATTPPCSAWPCPGRTPGMSQWFINLSAAAPP